MKNSSSSHTVDKRVVERNIKKGILSRDDYERHLAALPDVSDQSELLKARLSDDVVDDDDSEDDDDDDVAEDDEASED